MTGSCGGNRRFADNWELSAQRALTVTRALIDAGVPSSSVFAAAFGSQQPVSSNADNEGRAKNRRVEIAPVPRPSSATVKPVNSDVSDVSGNVASAVRSTLDAWRERGADRLNPVRFHFIEALDRRAASHSGEARRILDDRLSKLLEAYANDYASRYRERHVPNCRECRRTRSRCACRADRVHEPPCAGG
jgi:hypothetical protein